jgi:RAD51-like protein 2
MDGSITKLSQPIPLAHLPLRPSTFAILRGSGFHTVKDVYDTVQRHGGISNLVTELKHCNSDNKIEGSSVVSQNTGTIAEVYAQNLYNEIVEAVFAVTEESTVFHMKSKQVRNGRNGVTGTVKTAADLLREHNETSCSSTNSSSIITFCRALDELLGGGIALGEVTELAGSPGSGKTTLCLQLSVNAALPYYCGGVQGRTVYIDTEGSFAADRCYDLATHLIRHVQTGLRRKHRQSTHDKSTTATISTSLPVQHQWNVTAEDILNNIIVYRVHDVADLTSVLNGALPALLMSSSSDEQQLPIRLVVIDSIAFPYRAATTARQSLTSSASASIDYVARTQQLTATAAALNTIAVRYQLAVVSVNQMTTTFITNADSSTATASGDENVNNTNENLGVDLNTSRAKLIPALGESWAHAVTTRLVLSKPMTYQSSVSSSIQRHQHRVCSLTKSPRLPTGEAHLVIVEAGIRGVEYIEATNNKV